MTTIGMMSFYGRNYGGVLQATALQHVLREMGHEVELISFARDPLLQLPRWRRVRNRVYTRMDSLLTGGRRDQLTDDFKRQHLRFTDRSFDALTLLQSPPEFETYLVGSDQVWNLKLTGGCTSYLLDFVRSGHKRIAYAASLGADRIGCADRSVLARHLPNFDSISVREASAVALVEELIGRTPVQAVDPTLLVSRAQWGRYGADGDTPRPESFLLCYMMAQSRPMQQQVTRYATQLSKQTGLPCVFLNQRVYRKLTHPTAVIDLEAGPGEFLRYFAQTSGVITDSFHGTAFAVNFGKPFMTFYPPMSGLSRSGRIVSFLEKLRLKEFGVVAGEQPSCEFSWDMDFTEAHRLLDRWREDSRDFLKRALGPASPGR